MAAPLAPFPPDDAAPPLRLALAQPCVCTAIGATAHACLERVAADLIGAPVPLAGDEDVVALTLTALGAAAPAAPPSEVKDNNTDIRIRAVAPAALRAIVRGCLERFITPQVRFVRWIALFDVADRESVRVFTDHLLPLFVALNAENPAALTLTVICIDDSEDFISPHLPVYQELAARVFNDGVSTVCQCYLARKRLSPAGILDTAAFAQFAALSCYALILGSVPDVPDDFAVPLYHNPAPPAIHLAPDATPIFARLAVQRVRSLTQLLAERCAQAALDDFAERQVRQPTQVRVGWDAPRADVHRPDASPQTVAVVAGILQRGPNARIPPPTHIFGNAEAQYARLERAVTARAYAFSMRGIPSRASAACTSPL